MHILCVSNDEMLMRTRELLLRSAGYEVTSCWGFVEGAAQCRRDDLFDFFLICQIAAYRENHGTPIIALLHHEDIKPEDVILHQPKEGPAALLAIIRKALATTSAVVTDA